jgi:hypothetical protein
MFILFLGSKRAVNVMHGMFIIPSNVGAPPPSQQLIDLNQSILLSLYTNALHSNWDG